MAYKKLLVIILAAGSCMAACNRADTKGTAPQHVLDAFIHAIAKTDFDEAKKYATAGSQPSLGLIGNMVSLAGYTNAATGDYIKKMQAYANQVAYTNERTSGDTTYIDVTGKNSTAVPVTMQLIKEQGNWKVDFSMAAFLNMAKQQQPGAGDNINKNEAVKKADSLLQQISPEKLKALKEKLRQLQQ